MHYLKESASLENYFERSCLGISLRGIFLLPLAIILGTHEVNVTLILLSLSF